MQFIVNFLQKLSKNPKINTIIIIFLLVFGVIFAICGVISMINPVLLAGLTTPFGFFMQMFMQFALALLWIVLDKLNHAYGAIESAEEIIRHLENENKDYQMNTEVLINDPEIKRIMQGRLARQSQL